MNCLEPRHNLSSARTRNPLVGRAWECDVGHAVKLHPSKAIATWQGAAELQRFLRSSFVKLGRIRLGTAHSFELGSILAKGQWPYQDSSKIMKEIQLQSTDAEHSRSHILRIGVFSFKPWFQHTTLKTIKALAYLLSMTLMTVFDPPDPVVTSRFP